jgi:hypothetical protein
MTSDTPQAPIAEASQLPTLADEAGFKDLSDAERKLLEALPLGEFAICSPNENDDDPENDPSKGDHWPESRRIRAGLIRWLCVNEAARKLIDTRGIQIYAANVIEPLASTSFQWRSQCRC